MCYLFVLGAYAEDGDGCAFKSRMPSTTITNTRDLREAEEMGRFNAPPPLLSLPPPPLLSLTLPHPPLLDRFLTASIVSVPYHVRSTSVCCVV